MAKLTEKLREDYEIFLVEIEMMLEEDLNELLANSVSHKNQKVAFDAKSLDAIEDFYLRVLSGEEKIPISQARINRIIIAFYGEAVRSRTGRGEWELCEDENDSAFGLPVVNLGPDEIAYSPVEVREAQIQNRKPVLSKSIDYMANKEEFEANFFKEFE